MILKWNQKLIRSLYFIRSFSITVETRNLKCNKPHHYKYSKLEERTTSQQKLNFSTQVEGVLRLQEYHLEIACGPNFTLPLNYLWLRDHCRCEKCYNHMTNQRKNIFLEIPPDIKPQKCSLTNHELIIEWQGKHSSVFDLDWLQKQSYDIHIKKTRKEQILWNKNNAVSNVAQVDAELYINSDVCLREFLMSLAMFGVAFVKNVPATVDATKKVVERIAHVHRTFYGDMWEFGDNDLAFKDTAYTNEDISVHNDSTYLTESTGLQVLHCLEHLGSGGETVLVDGFRAAYNLKNSNEDSFNRLCSMMIESEYIDEKKHYVSLGPILKLNPLSKQLQQIRFNPMDRAILNTVPSHEVQQFYDDFRLLMKEVYEPEGEWWFKLQPGLVLFMDNWRVLHGRAKFTGPRKMTGCYIGHADYYSKARVLGIL